MRTFLATAAIALSSLTISAQSPSKHAFGISFQNHYFENSATKSELQLRYLWSPHESFGMATNLGYGTYGNLQHSDGFLHLHQLVSPSLELNVKPLYKITGQRSYSFDPYIGVGGGIAWLENKQQVSKETEFRYMNVGLGTYFKLKRYTSLFASYQQQSSLQYKSTLEKSNFVQFGLVYRFHQKLQKINDAEYDRLAEQFMNSVVTKEEVEKAKNQVEDDKEMMENSYEEMLMISDRNKRIIEAALIESRKNNEVLLESNFEMSLKVNEYEKEIARLKQFCMGSRELSDYELVESFGNPYSNEPVSNTRYIALSSSYNSYELKALSEKHLTDFEDVSLLKNEQGLFILMVRLDLSPDELQYEIYELSHNFPRLFQLMGKG